MPFAKYGKTREIKASCTIITMRNYMEDDEYYSESNIQRHTSIDNPAYLSENVGCSTNIAYRLAKDIRIEIRNRKRYICYGRVH